MLPADVTTTLTALFGPDEPDTLAPTRVDPAALALADTDHSGTLSRAEVQAALLADRLRLDLSSDRLVPTTPLTLAAPEAVARETVPLDRAVETVRSTPVPDIAALTQRTLRQSQGRPPAPTPRPPISPRPPDPLMLTPHVGGMAAATVTTHGVDLTSPLNPKGTFRLGMHVDTDQTLPQRQGTMVLEESHPNYLAWPDVGGSGLNLGLDSRTRLEMVSRQSGPPTLAMDADSTAVAVRHEERLHVDRAFGLFGKRPDTTVQAGYLVGFGPQQWPDPTPTTVPLTQYATVAVTTRPHPLFGITGEVYVPVQDGPAGRGAHPIGRVAATVPYLTIGTTQSVESARYDASLSATPVRHLQLAASGAIDQNRLTGATGVTAGVQLSVPW